MRLASNETHHPFGMRKQIGLKAIRFVTEISQDETPERGAEDRSHAENHEVRAHNAGWNRDHALHDLHQPRTTTPPALVATQPHFRPRKFSKSPTHDHP